MKAPLFVKIEHYTEITDTIAGIKSKLDEAKEVLIKLDDVKQKEDNELLKWQAELEEAEKRLKSITEQLPKPE
ncbi:hypothetical protein JXB11_01620 [Candidatus Woesearchaeota archaeon]|nr:hypothetical protein [Candidatus Woesearchaeota archaeon]